MMLLPNCALLLLNTISSEPSDKSLCYGKIKSVYLSSNIATLLQSVDQDVLRNVKHCYRVIFLLHIIQNEDTFFSASTN